MTKVKISVSPWKPSRGTAKCDVCRSDFAYGTVITPDSGCHTYDNFNKLKICQDPDCLDRALSSVREDYEEETSS